ARRWRIGLISDGDPGTQRRKLEALGVAGRFELSLLTGELGDGCAKPSPRPFLTAAERFGVAPAEAIYLADNPIKDFRGPNLVGTPSLRIRRPRGVYAHLDPQPGWEPTACVATLDEALAFISDW